MDADADADAERRVRVRHALRCALGGSALAAVALATPATSGCTPSVLFFISTVAGTPENRQGFQLRSASLTFAGALLGAGLFFLVAVVAAGSAAATFFCAAPPLAFLSALRTHRALAPMPAVANVFAGFLLISRFGEPRRALPRILAAFAADAALAWAAAVAVSTLLPPDRAADAGRALVAAELRRLGAVVSAVATKVFSRAAPAPAPPSADRGHLSVFLDDGRAARAARHAGLLPDDYALLTAAIPNRRLPRRAARALHEARVRAAEASLAAMRYLRPFGRTRVSDYAALARAAQLLDAAEFEPRILPEAAARWRNVAAWTALLRNLRALVSKVSSLETVTSMRPDQPHRFSDEVMTQFLGDAFLPLWVSHFASCSAACAKMSTAMSSATCKEMFRLPEVGRGSGVGTPGTAGDLDWTIDPRLWNSRRADMYFGFLLRYRYSLRQYCRQRYREGRVAASQQQSERLTTPQRSLLRAAKCKFRSEPERLGLKHSFSAPDVNALSRKRSNAQVHDTEEAPVYEATPMSERQALSYFALTGHALGEEIAHVQQSMTELAASSDARGLFAPLQFLVIGFIALWKGSKDVLGRKLSPWEVKFACTHSMLLLSILGLALFLPLRDSFEASELAWVFTSAALAAQLSAEPTMFIGTIRVIATISGALVAFGFNTVLNVIGRSRGSIQYIVIPYIALVTIASLLLVPTSFRYAAFLLVVTNAIMIFCPRSSAECSQVLEQQSSDCFPDWRYTISRAINVSIGVVFALFFHLMFWPRFANQVAVRNLADAFISASRLFAKLHQTYFSYGSTNDSTAKSSHQVSSDDSTFSEPSLHTNEFSFNGDIYCNQHPMLPEIHAKVGQPLATAMLLVKSEADLWRRGPFRLYPIIPHLLSDFVALNVSLGEMAAILGRRPIFSPSYGRSVFDHYILPMIDTYETIQVSLHNMVGVADRTVTDTVSDSLEENVADLRQAIIHLARTRGQLRQDAEKRAMEFKASSAMALARQRTSRLSTPEMSVDESFAKYIVDDIDSERRRRWRPLSERSKSESDLTDHKRIGERNLCVDDVVLYDAFTFITDGCLSAFVRIAATVLVEAQSQLDETLDEKNKKKVKRKRT